MSVKVLIVDDNEQNRKLLRDFCQISGHKVIAANDGIGALDLLKEKPDIILLDILMPKLDGVQTLKQIRGRKEALNIPVIMLSAVDEMDIAVECIQSGADDFLPKPFNPVMLEARINSSIQKKRFFDLEIKYKSLLEELSKNLEVQVQKKNKALYLAHQQLRILDQSKNNLLKMIAHEFNTPMNGMLGAFDYLMSKNNADDPAKDPIAEVFRRSANRLNDLIKQSDILTRVTEETDTIVNSYYNLKGIFTATFASIHDFAQNKDVLVDKFPTINDDLEIYGDEGLLYEAFRAIVRTAIKLSNPNQKISFTVEENVEEDYDQDINIDADISQNLGRFKFSVFINSMNLTEKESEDFINGFGIKDNIIIGEDLGLDPTLVKQVLAMFNGNVAACKSGPNGIEFKISIPVKNT